MILIVDRQLFKDTLESISSALGGNDSDPIAGHFLFRVHPTSCEVLAGGKTVGLCGYRHIQNLAPTEVADGKIVEFTAQGAKLLGFLGAAGNGNLNISYQDSTKQVNIRPDASSTDFNTEGLDPQNGFNFGDDFEAAKKGGVKGTFTKEDLEKSFAFTNPFIGMNLSNPGFGLCCLETGDQGGLIKSGDGKSVAIYRQSNFAGSFKLRGDKLSNLNAFIKKSDGALTLLEGDNYYFIVDVNNSYYGFKKVAFDFPEMKGLDLFAETGTHIFRVNKEAIKGALNRLKWSLDNDQYRISFQLKDGDGSDDILNSTIYVTATSSNGKTSSESIKIHRSEGSGEAEFNLNYKYVLQGIDKFDGDDITLYLTLAKFSYIKILEKLSDNGITSTKVLFLALMKSPR